MMDHALAITFGVAFPLVATRLYARRRPLLLAGDSGARLREYRETVLWLGSMGIATLLVWAAAGRELSSLGLAFDRSWPSLLGIAFALAMAILLSLQVRAVRRDGRAQAAVRKALDPVREYLPEDRPQARLFRAVSVSAGIGEELFYRGFLLWYLMRFTPLGWAIAISSMLFGLAHVMHGVQATVRATLVGALLAGLYVLSGALWGPMLLHAAIDLTTGETALAVYGRESRAGG